MINLTEKEIQLILESLLYTASPEISMRMYRDDVNDIVDLAVKIRQKYPTINTKNTFILEELEICNIQKRFKENFPELAIN